MKTFLTCVSLVSVFWFASAAPLTDRLRECDAVVVASLSNIVATTSTNAAGARVTSFTCDATLVRSLKGTVPATFRFTGDTETAYVSNEPGNSQLRCFLLFLKRSGDTYSPSDPDALAPVFGRGQPQDRVLWPHCTSLEEAERAIRKVLGQ